MKRFAFIVIVVLLFVSFFGVRPALAQTIFESTVDSKTLADCSDSELALRYQDAARLAVNEGKTNEAIQIKRLISEEIGERGAKDFARNRGWEPILTKAEKSTGHPQGFDQVWKGVDGKIHVIEAKGGESRPSGNQGTSKWCVEAAEKTLKNHAATEAEKSAARTVLEAASKGKLDIYVVRTSHVQGAAGNTICKSVEECTEEATRLAKELLSRNAVHGFESGAEAFSRNASKTVEAAESARYSGSWNSPVYERPVYEPELPSIRSEYPVEASSNSLGNTMKSTTRSNEAAAERGAARAAEAASKGVTKAAKGATKTLTKATTAAEVATGIGVVVDAGLRIKDSYDIEQKYSQGEIDNHERVVGHVKNGAGMAGGWGGAAAGGYAGATGGAAAGAAVGSVVPVVGTAIGGAVGGVVGGIGGAIGGYIFGEKAAEAGVDCADGFFNGR
ncbi:MAG: hypothetical protein IJF84_09080 [Thermoguttaceae bacterium]|nr:hypothetical protein [Thermoguttaceae bacterium]